MLRFGRLNIEGAAESSDGLDLVTSTSSSFSSCSAAISSICPIFQHRNPHMHTAAATYIMPVNI